MREHGGVNGTIPVGKFMKCLKLLCSDTYTKTRQKVSAMSGVTTGSMLMKLLFEAM